ncbi:hypothetical protein CapIbe_012873 [Capra ibex]
MEKLGTYHPGFGSSCWTASWRSIFQSPAWLNSNHWSPFGEEDPAHHENDLSWNHYPEVRSILRTTFSLQFQLMDFKIV